LTHWFAGIIESHTKIVMDVWIIGSSDNEALYSSTAALNLPVFDTY